MGKASLLANHKVTYREFTTALIKDRLFETTSSNSRRGLT